MKLILTINDPVGRIVRRIEVDPKHKKWAFDLRQPGMIRGTIVGVIELEMVDDE